MSFIASLETYIVHRHKLSVNDVDNQEIYVLNVYESLYNRRLNFYPMRTH